MGFFVVVLWVGFFPFLVTATFSASGSLFSAAFFFTLFVLISVGGSLGWYSFFVVGQKVILFSFLRLLFVSFYLYLFAFFKISIAESISSEVIRSLRLLRSGLGVGSLLLLLSSYDLWLLWCLDGGYFWLLSRSRCLERWSLLSLSLISWWSWLLLWSRLWLWWCGSGLGRNWVLSWWSWWSQ